MNQFTKSPEEIFITTERSVEPVALVDATVDELFSIRAYAWVSYFANFGGDDNGLGQRYHRTGSRYQQRVDDEAKRIRVRAELFIDQIEGEIVARGLHPKSKDYRRVVVRFDYPRTCGC